jgi:hypothetical protein
MVEYIQINGKRTPVKYGFNALRIFTTATGVTLEGLQGLSDSMSLEHAIALMYAGLKDGHRAEKLPFKLTIDEVADILDEDQSVLQQCIDVFTRSFSAKAEGKQTAQQ